MRLLRTNKYESLYGGEDSGLLVETRPRPLAALQGPFSNISAKFSIPCVGKSSLELKLK